MHARSWTAHSVRPNGIDIYVDVFDINTGHFLDIIANLADNGAADRCNVDTVLHGEMQVDVDTAILRFGNAHAARHVFAAQQVCNAVGHRTDGHAFDAEAAHRRIARDIRQHFRRDIDKSEIGFDRHHNSSSIQWNPIS